MPINKYLPFSFYPLVYLSIQCMCSPLLKFFLCEENWHFQMCLLLMYMLYMCREKLNEKHLFLDFHFLFHLFFPTIHSFIHSSRQSSLSQIIQWYIAKGKSHNQFNSKKSFKLIPIYWVLGPLIRYSVRA